MNNKLFVAAGLAFCSAFGFAQDFRRNWTETTYSQFPVNFSETITRLSSYRTMKADIAGLKAQVAGTAMDFNGHTSGKPKSLAIPRADGSTSTFRVTEYNLLSADLQAKYPNYHFYYGVNESNPVERVRFGFTDLGFHSTIYSPNGDEFIDPVVMGDPNQYYIYNRKNLRRYGSFTCGVTEFDQAIDDLFAAPKKNTIGLDSVGGNLKTYRLALNGTIEYTAARGGTVASATSSMTASMNRVNGVYEVDFGIRMSLNLLNPFIGSDPFTNSNGVTMLSQNQTQCDSNPGNASYDIGHVFSTGGGGVAQLACVGVTGSKAKGVTGSGSPTGDAFDIDYVAHEMGHQFGGNHTFNGSAGSCGGGNRAASAAYEPGSGSTIMAYAGICGTDDLQTNSDAYFHQKSIAEIVAWRNNAASGGTAVANGNSAPVVNAGADYTIPMGTPFRLNGSATDANGDALTYCWEQYDLGSTTAATNTASGVLFRSFTPKTVTYRTFPNLTAILNNTATPWEVLPTVARNMNFRLTVRDNRAGGGENNNDAMVVAVAGSAFSISSQNTATAWNAGSSQTITWTVGGGSVAANVNILFSRTGGTNFDTGGYETILANTPNDGSQTVNVPWGTTTTGRIKIEPVGNIFFDVNNAAISINESNSVSVAVAPGTVQSGADATGTVTLAGPAPTGGLTFNISDSNAATTMPATVTVPAGSTSQTFTINTTAVASTQSVTLNLTRTGESYTKTATYTLNANSAPVAVADSYTFPGGAAYTSTTSVLANDSDANGDSLTASLVTSTSNGTLSLGTNGQFTYTPNSGFTGTDSFTYKPFDGALNGNTVTVTLNVQATNQVLSGNITLQNWIVSPAGQVINVEVYAVGNTTTPLRTGTATLDGSGNWSLTLSTPLAAGNYDVRIRGWHWLYKRLSNRTFTATSATGLNASLINGDIAADNIVDIADYTAMALQFDQTGTLSADLNGDGIVDIADYTILATNFDLTGDN